MITKKNYQQKGISLQEEATEIGNALRKDFKNTTEVLSRNFNKIEKIFEKIITNIYEEMTDLSNALKKDFKNTLQSTNKTLDKAKKNIANYSYSLEIQKAIRKGLENAHIDDFKNI